MRFTTKITECTLNNGILAFVFETGGRRIYGEAPLDSRALAALIGAIEAGARPKDSKDFVGLTTDVEVKEIRVVNGDSVLVATNFFPSTRRV
jgi:hypothetical protein